MEVCIQNTCSGLIENLLISNKLGNFSTERGVAAAGYFYPNHDTKEDVSPMTQFR